MDRTEPKRKPRAKRNPRARRRAIAEAAAKLLLEEGTERVTHRKVAEEAGVPLGATTQYFSSIAELKRAGYELIAQGVLDGYRKLLDDFAASSGDSRALTRIIWGYLEDDAETRADMALYAAAVKDPTLRELTQRGYRLMSDELAFRLDARRARAIGVLFDGLLVQKVIYGTPFDEAFIYDAVTALLEMPATQTEGKDA